MQALRDRDVIIHQQITLRLAPCCYLLLRCTSWFEHLLVEASRAGLRNEPWPCGGAEVFANLLGNREERRNYKNSDY
jgi:hypothetical protein